jgi:nitrogenase molybdenum-iron protein alpha/beta subunit
LEERARELIDKEMAGVSSEVDTLRRFFDGKTALIEISEYPGPIRALSLATMASEFGARPVVINLHPYTVKERMPSIKFLLGRGENPEVILTKGLFSLGSFNVSSETQAEVEYIASQYDDAIFVGSPRRQPGVPQMNMTTITGFPQYGYAGIRNMARLIQVGYEHAARPRSPLFRRVLYGG